ncbi:MAG: ATP synthase F0 subunit B [Deltaproteobacteria bacterium]|nr:ATP synthase F0 subunit B [Deltaproteobacteria bacterium]
MIKLPPDITFVIQLVGFVVFWQLMRVLLFSPMQAALKKRAESTGGARLRAEAMIAEAAQIDAAVQSGLADARQRGARQAEDIRRASEAEEHGILERYRGEATSVLERERAATDAQVREARAPLEAEASKLAGSVVLRVLGRAA